MSQRRLILTSRSFQKRFLPGMALSDFVSSHPPQDVLHLKSADPTYYWRICPPGLVTRILEEQLLVKPSIRMVRSDGVLPISEITTSVPYGRFAFEDVVDIASVQRRFDEGYTINLRAAHLQVARIRKASLILADLLNCYIRANLYITPDNQSGLRPHYDVDDVFVLQIAGQKRWTFYDNIFENPTRRFQFNQEEYEVGSPISTLDLNPGDFLFVPGGVPHSAAALSTSCHITFGIEKASQFSYLQAVLSELETRAEFRKFLDPNVLASRGDDYLREVLKSAIDALEGIEAERLRQAAESTLASNRRRMLDRNAEFLGGL